MAIIIESPRALRAEVRDSFGRITSVNLSSYLLLGHDKRVVVDPVIAFVSRSATVTQVNQLRALKEIGDGISAAHIARLPRNETDWQSLILHLHSFVLSRIDRHRKLAPRVRSWNRAIAPLLVMLRDVADVIPIGVEIPKSPENLEDLDTSSYDAVFVGDDEPISSDDVTHEDKLLVSISLSRTDAQYLEELRNTLLHRRALLHEICSRWWKQIKAHYDFGRSARELISNKVLTSLVSDIEAQKAQVSSRHMATGRTTRSLGVLLAILETECNWQFNKALTEQCPYLPHLTSISLPTDTPLAVSPHVTKTQRINWMLGTLSRFDVAICMALLIFETPKFTPASLLEATVHDQTSKLRLELADTGETFRIEKARANAVKNSTLSELSVEIITQLTRMTAPLRTYLAAQESPLRDLLFICADRGKIRAPTVSGISVQLSAAKSQTTAPVPPVFRHFPELEAEGFTVGSITHSKIRATEGVLEWFRTGSIAAMSKKLGNARKTVLAHYLPEQLVMIWNTRQVRRFQNLWLSVAASREPYLLLATDFESLTELNEFLTQMLQSHSANSSPLAEALHSAFWTLAPADEALSVRSNAALAVPISVPTLTMLYMYQNAAFASGVEMTSLETPDPASGCSPIQFVTLSELLRHQLPGERNPALRRAHAEAAAIADMPGRYAKWTELFTARKTYAPASI